MRLKKRFYCKFSHNKTKGTGECKDAIVVNEVEGKESNEEGMSQKRDQRCADCVALADTVNEQQRYFKLVIRM